MLLVTPSLRFWLLLVISSSFNLLFAQSLETSKQIIRVLCSDSLNGRGYIDQGVNKAAHFLANEFAKRKIKPLGNSYFQEFSFPINTHPGIISCRVDGEKKNVGIDFLVDPATDSVHTKCKLLQFNMRDSLDRFLLMKKIQKGFEKDEALVLRFYNSRKKEIVDSCKAFNHIPALCISTEEKKLTHSVSTKLQGFASVTFADSMIAHKEFIELDVENVFHPSFVSKNVMATIKGKIKDSFLVFTAHYDHLGMQGNAQFPGASDNASGVSMIYYLADYYTKHKPLYTILFILFSGEEAGLLGSSYFTEHPTFPLQKIKQVINIDIMGNASEGITVVNAEQCKSLYNTLLTINTKKKYLPEIRSRGQTKNSDHYPFSEKGVPAIFIYSLGGKGYYHDVMDTADNIDLTNYENVAHLLIDACSNILKKQ